MANVLCSRLACGSKWRRGSGRSELGILAWPESGCVFVVRGIPDPIGAALAAVTGGVAATARAAMAGGAPRSLVRAIASRLIIEVLDRKGRLTLPPEGISAAALSNGRVVLRGARDHVEIRSPSSQGSS